MTWVPQRHRHRQLGDPAVRAIRRRRLRADGVEPGRRTLGLVGQLKNKKGVGFLLDALLASGHAEAFHLLLVGEVEDVVDGTARRRARTRRLPFIDRYDLPGVYAACDLVALPVVLRRPAERRAGGRRAGRTAARLGRGRPRRPGRRRDRVQLPPPVTAHGCRAAIDRAARGDRRAAGQARRRRGRARAPRLQPGRARPPATWPYSRRPGEEAAAWSRCSCSPGAAPARRRPSKSTPAEAAPASSVPVYLRVTDAADHAILIVYEHGGRTTIASRLGASKSSSPGRTAVHRATAGPSPW